LSQFYFCFGCRLSLASVTIIYGLQDLMYGNFFKKNRNSVQSITV